MEGKRMQNKVTASAGVQLGRELSSSEAVRCRGSS